jgi:hypothetical protein
VGTQESQITGKAGNDMKNKENIYRSEAEVKLKQEGLCKALEVEMAGASALMEAETLLDSKSSDYVLGFLNGFAHCLKLGERLDVINGEQSEGPL